MGLRYQVGSLPRLVPGEKVLYCNRMVWGESVKSLPNWRVLFSLLPVVQAGIYVTDRRVLHAVPFLWFFSVEFRQWFDGEGEPGDNERVTDVRVGKNRLLGPLGRYLEIVSENPEKKWYRSRRCRVRLYMRHPEAAYKIVSQAANGRQHSG